MLINKLRLSTIEYNLYVDIISKILVQELIFIINMIFKTLDFLTSDL